MSIENFIQNKAQQKAETESVTVRLPTDTVAAIDEFSLSLGVTRQEVIAEFIKDSLGRALVHYEKMQNKPDSLELLVNSDDCKASRYFVVNTNRANNDEDHFNMVSNGIAAAFTEGWKHKIDVLRKDDVVFLYESKVGIVGVGKASGKLEILGYYEQPEGTHQQVLINYKKVLPMSAREIKKLTGTNMRFLHTMFTVADREGKLIEKHLTSTDQSPRG